MRNMRLRLAAPCAHRVRVGFGEILYRERDATIRRWCGPRWRIATSRRTRDMAVIAETAQHVAVMYAGRIVESGATEEIFGDPRYTYTIGLLNCVPRLDQEGRKLVPIEGLPPNLISPPAGCAFAPRCNQAREGCDRRHALTTYEENRQVSCWCAIKRLL